VPDWRIGRGARIGQIDVNRKQKPLGANLTGDSASAGPASTPETGDGQDKEAPDEAPPWAAPLRDLYQQVVEEPLPDFLSDLLSRLDRDTQ